jgi:hypothetical protein
VHLYTSDVVHLYTSSVVHLFGEINRAH